MNRAVAAVGAVIAIAFLNGCVRRDGRNSDCIWPGEAGAKALRAGEPGYAEHLGADAEFAEELAIRFMDAQHGPRSGKFVSQQAAGQAKNRCLGELFGKIGETHQVTAQEVFQFLGHRELATDLALNAPFALLYGLAAVVMIEKLKRRYPIEEGLMVVLITAGLTSLASGAGAVILGEQWSILAEMSRIGNGHLSNRVDRLPLALHRLAFFAGAVALFWAIGAARYRSGNAS